MFWYTMTVWSLIVGFNPKKTDMTINLPRQLCWVWCGIGVWYIILQVVADMNDFDDHDSNAGLEIIQWLLWLDEQIR